MYLKESQNILDFESQIEQKDATLELYIENNSFNILDTLNTINSIPHTSLNNISSSEDNPLIKELTAINGQKIHLIYSPIIKKVSAYISEDNKIIEIKHEKTPKNLIGLNDSKVFEAFCSNIYVKVAVLSDGEYKLYVESPRLRRSASNSCYRFYWY